MKITREELYRRVWEAPAVQVAKALGISDVALSKICKKYQIPKPAIAFWIKKQNGKRVPKRKPLPIGHFPDPCEISIRGTPALMQELTPGVRSAVELEKQPINAVTIAPDYKVTHPLVLKTKARLKAGVRCLRGEAPEPILDIAVSEEFRDRALRLWDALIHALESRGFDVYVEKWGGPCERYYTKVKINGTAVQFWMEDRSNKVALKREDYPNNWIMPGSYGLKPTGVLYFMIERSPWMASKNKYRQQFGETAAKPHESNLNEFIVGLMRAADGLKAQGIIDAERDRVRAIEWEKEEAIRLKAKREQNRRNDLARWTRQHARSTRYNRFLADLESAALAQGKTVAPGTPLGDWLVWARERAHEFDPIRKILDADPPSLD